MKVAIDPIHTIIWIVSFIGIIISLSAIYFRRDRWGYVIAPLTYLVNVFFYNTALHATLVLNIGNMTLQQLDFWSSVVRLHALFLAIMYVIFRAVRRN